MKKLFRGLFLIAAISTLFVGNVFAAMITPSGELDGLRGDVVAYKAELGYKSIDIVYNENTDIQDMDEDSESGNVVVKLTKNDGSEDALEEIPVYRNQESSDGEEVRVDIGSTAEGRLYTDQAGLEIITSKRNEISEILKSKKVEQNDWKRFFGEMKDGKNGIQNIRGIINADISPSLQKGSDYMNREGAGVKDKINLVLSVFMWFLWVGFLAFELINGACILFPIFRDKVTGDGTNVPWFLTVNTKQRLANMEEEPMKKWLTNEVTRIAVFFLITIGIFSGVFYLLIEAIMNLLPS